MRGNEMTLGANRRHHDNELDGGRLCIFWLHDALLDVRPRVTRQSENSGVDYFIAKIL